MSTKIYNGMRVNASADKLMAMIPSIRETMCDVYDSHIAGKLTDDIINAIVKSNKNIEKAGEQLHENILQLVTTLIGGDKEDDSSAPQLVIVRPDHGEYFLAVPVGEETDDMARVLVEKYTEFSEYGYWNNTDQPDNVTDEEWDRRGDDWDAIGYGPVIEYGVTVQLSDMRKNPLLLEHEMRFNAMQKAFTDEDKLVSRVEHDYVVSRMIDVSPDSNDVDQLIFIVSRAHRVYKQLKESGKITSSVTGMEDMFDDNGELNTDAQLPVVTVSISITDDELLKLIEE